MKSRRPISINNSLVHGICNYSCRLCGIHQPGYSGPREYQSREVTEALIGRIREAAASGVYIRYLANAGDGEPTLHPEFSDRLRLFGRMLKEWEVSSVPPPEISVVTNGSRLRESSILESLAENDISLIISFPSSNPRSYGQIMQGDPGRGDALLANVLPGIEKAMGLAAGHRLPHLSFHISPPEITAIRRDFSETISCLTRLASDNGLKTLQLVLFPAPSNRSGLVGSGVAALDMYTDLFSSYNNRLVNKVTIEMKRVMDRFFMGPGEIIDLIRSFRFPCLWNGNFFIAADGSSICCNDQSVRNPLGNIMDASIPTLMKNKELYRPGPVCRGCNQAPHHLQGSPAAVLYSRVARLRMGLASVASALGCNRSSDTRCGRGSSR